MRAHTACIHVHAHTHGTHTTHTYAHAHTRMHTRTHMHMCWPAYAHTLSGSSNTHAQMRPIPALTSTTWWSSTGRVMMQPCSNWSGRGRGPGLGAVFSWDALLARLISNHSHAAIAPAWQATGIGSDWSRDVPMMNARRVWCSVLALPALRRKGQHTFRMRARMSLRACLHVCVCVRVCVRACACKEGPQSSKAGFLVRGAAEPPLQQSYRATDPRGHRAKGHRATLAAEPRATEPQSRGPPLQQRLRGAEQAGRQTSWPKGPKTP